LSRAAAEWLNITEPEHTTAITFEDINDFRAGPYDDATVDTQKKWCHVMLRFLPSVCAKYGKSDIQVAMAASEVSSTSDETLVMWLLRFNAQDWETENSIEQALNEDDTSPTTRKRKRKGPHMSQQNLQEFLDMMNATTAKRGDDGNGWDDALLTAAAREAHESANGTKVHAFDDGIVGSGKAAAVPGVVMPYNNPKAVAQPYVAI
jgi:hypothetical protein